MADTASHDKQMKNFMRTENRVAGIEKRKFKCVNDTTDCVNDSAGQKKCKCT